MNSHIESIYRTRRIIGKSGIEMALHSEVDPAEGELIQRIISEDSSVSKTLEIGCGYGLSALHICDALRQRSNPHHTIIDPFQYSEWDGAGIKNLEDAGFTFFKLIEKGSEVVLPELLSVGEGTFDLVFIDGWHTFDHTVLECFYATRLLRIGGYLLIDDAGMPSVGRAAYYFSRFPCYEVVGAVSAGPRLKRRLAKTILRFLPPSRRRRWIHPALLHRTWDEPNMRDRAQIQLVAAPLPDRRFDQKNTRMVALKKTAKDDRWWDWFPEDF